MLCYDAIKLGDDKFHIEHNLIYFRGRVRKHPLKLPPTNKKGEDARVNFVYRYLYCGPPSIYTEYVIKYGGIKLLLNTSLFSATVAI